MNVTHLIPTFEIEATALELAVRAHPALKPFFTRDFTGKTTDELKQAYLRLLKITAGYVAYTVPMLRAAGEALRGGDDEDRAWSERFLAYAQDETDTKEDYGHHAWARNDMAALGAPAAFIDAPEHPTIALYGKFFVEQAAAHPYAILGSKGVLEHGSIRVCDDLVKGVLASGIEGAENAVTFFAHHGVLDIDHVREGDANLERLTSVSGRTQVLTGAYFTSGSYRAFLNFAV